MKFALLILCATFFAGVAHAQQADDVGVSIAENADQKADQKAKRRSYPGGRDEEDLKVQTSLPQPTRDPDVRAGAAGAPSAEEAVHD